MALLASCRFAKQVGQLSIPSLLAAARERCLRPTRFQSGGSGVRQPEEATMADPNSLGRAYAEQAVAALFPNGIRDLGQLEEVAEQVRARVHEHIAAIAQAVSRFAPLAKESKALHELDDRLASVGWFVPPTLAAESRAELYDLAVAKGDPRGAVDYLKYCCSAGLAREIVDRACSAPITNTRCDLLQPALSAHLHADYILSVPVLLAQVEGAYREWLGAVGQQRNSPFRKASAQELADIRGVLDVSDLLLYEHLGTFSRVIPEQLAASVQSPADLTTLRQRFPLGFLSRHAVMHGIDINYGSEENSIKALFVLDVAVELFSRFEPKHGSLS